MSSQKSMNSTVIILAIVGLLVGAGGGYFLANNSAQSQIATLNSEIETIISHMNSLETQIEERETEIDSLEADISTLETEITTQTNTINNLQNDLTTKDGTISSLEDQIDALSVMTVVQEGYVQYSLYGFSFEYPNDMITSLAGVMESTATQNSGTFSASRDNGETYSVTWVHSMIELDIEGAIEGGASAVSEFTTARGGIKTIQHQGHTVSYDTLTLEDSTGSYTMIIGVFYCPENDKLFNINYLDHTQNTEQIWQEFLESFVCHIN